MCALCQKPNLTLEQIASQPNISQKHMDELVSRVLDIPSEPAPEDDELAEVWERGKRGN